MSRKTTNARIWQAVAVLAVCIVFLFVGTFVFQHRETMNALSGKWTIMDKKGPTIMVELCSNGQWEMRLKEASPPVKIGTGFWVATHSELVFYEESSSKLDIAFDYILGFESSYVIKGHTQSELQLFQRGNLSRWRRNE